jgi:hypothetical protein
MLGRADERHPVARAAGRLVARLEMLPAVAGMMGLVPVHALGVELGVLVAQVLVQLRFGTEPQFALRTLKHVHDSMLLAPYPSPPAGVPFSARKIRPNA